jgi:hypothetical protein
MNVSPVEPSRFLRRGVQVRPAPEDARDGDVAYSVTTAARS